MKEDVTQCHPLSFLERLPLRTIDIAHERIFEPRMSGMPLLLVSFFSAFFQISLHVVSSLELKTR